MSDLQDSQNYLIGIDGDGVIHKSKRATERQIKYINSLEAQLGYELKNHNQLTVWKAKAMIDRYLKRLEAKNQESLF